ERAFTAGSSALTASTVLVRVLTNRSLAEPKIRLAKAESIDTSMARWQIPGPGGGRRGPAGPVRDRLGAAQCQRSRAVSRLPYLRLPEKPRGTRSRSLGSVPACPCARRRYVHDAGPNGRGSGQHHPPRT